MDWGSLKDIGAGVAAVLAVLGAIGGAVAFILRRRDQGEAQLRDRIALEVDARIGRSLADIRQLQSEATSGVEAATEGARNTIEMLEKALEAASPSVLRLEEILRQVEPIVETADAFQVAPRLLLIEAMAEENSARATARLAQLLISEDATAADLERAGDHARQQLGDTGLALKLYTAALERDPMSVTAQAERLHLLADTRERTEAQLALESLARTHLNEPDIVGRLHDFYVQISDYDALRRISEELLAAGSTQRSRLYRGVGIAKRHLTYPEAEIIDSYEKALEAGRGRTDDFVNAAAAYAVALVEMNRLQRAWEVLNEAITLMPTDARLHFHRGEVLQRNGDYARARQNFERAVVLGNPEERRAAQERQAGLIVIESLQAEDAQPFLQREGDVDMVASPAQRGS